jgi:rod shape-determining protein MreD
VVDPITAQRWLYGGLFVLVAAMILFVQILPVTLVAGRWPGPDLILALAMAWGLRRPDYVPALLAAAVLLMADLLLQRPPGLWAALVVLALEVLRARHTLWRDLPFAVEWAVISALMAAVVMLNWLVLAVFMVDQASIGLYMIQLIGTVLAYPVAVLVSALVLGVRKVTPGEMEALGFRL